MNPCGHPFTLAPTNTMLRSLRTVLLVAVVCAAWLESLWAQPSLGETTVRVVPSVRSTEKSRSIRDFGYIEISGDIRQTAVSPLAAAFAEARRAAGSVTHSGEPIVRVFVNSRGGEVLAAIQMGQLIRSQAAEVWVDKNAECSSACIFLLAGGVSRTAIPGAKLGIHRPFFRPEEFAGLSHEQSQEKYSALAGGVKNYLAAMGVADTFYDAMIQIPSRKMEYVTEAFAESTRLLGDDPAYQEWQRAKDQNALGNEHLEKLERYTDCVNDHKSERDCARHLSGWNQ
jgi:hypothetical protein